MTRRPGEHRRASVLALALLATTLAAAPVARAQAVAPPTAVVADPPGGTVALVLSGGAARGAAHVGVLRVLREAGVPIDVVIGTSMGSLIGGLYAAGFDTRTLADVVAEVDPASAAELLVPPRGGILDGAPLSILLDALLDGMQLGETLIPFYPVVVELASSTAQVAPPGPMADAIRASAAIPVLLDPVEIDGRFFYDGGIRQSVPSALARELGATYVLAVWFDREIPYDPRNVQANLSRIYIGMLTTLNEGGKEGTNLLLDPNLVQNSYMDFALAAEFVRAGERVARDALPTILADLADLGIALEAPGDPNVGRAINEGWQDRLAAARRAVVVRPRPWNLGVDVGLSPAEWGERVTPPPVPASSRVRLSVDLRNGPLGAAAVGVSYARNVTGGTDAIELRAAWRPTYAVEPFASLGYDLAGTFDGRLGVRLRFDPGWTLEGAWRLPAGVVEGSAAWRGPGAWLDLDVAHGVGAGWTRAHAEARAALAAPEGTAFEPVTLRLRLLAGTATPNLPPTERFSVGPATGLRTLTPDAITAERLVAGSAELAWRLGAPKAVAEASLITPSVWAFLDAASFTGPDGAAGAWGAGVGAGLTGALFGFVPFDVGVDVGYGAPTDTWRLALRSGAAYPVAWRP